MLLRNCITKLYYACKRKGTRTPKAMSLNKSELIYIYLLRTPSRCFIGINTFQLGWYFTVSDRVIESLLALTVARFWASEEGCLINILLNRYPRNITLQSRGSTRAIHRNWLVIFLSINATLNYNGRIVFHLRKWNCHTLNSIKPKEERRGVYLTPLSWPKTSSKLTILIEIVVTIVTLMPLRPKITHIHTLFPSFHHIHGLPASPLRKPVVS